MHRAVVWNTAQSLSEEASIRSIISWALLSSRFYWFYEREHTPVIAIFYLEKITLL